MYYFPFVEKRQFCSTDVDFNRQWCSIRQSKSMNMAIGYEESCDNEFKMEDFSKYIDETCHGIADCVTPANHNEILFQPKFLKIQYTCKGIYTLVPAFPFPWFNINDEHHMIGTTRFSFFRECNYPNIQLSILCAC